jgi:hypothetical protein
MSFNGAKPTLQWTHTESNDNDQILENQVTTGTDASSNQKNIVTLGVVYSNTNVLKSLDFKEVSPKNVVTSLFDIKFKQCDLITDPLKLSDPTRFEFVIPSDSLAWIPPTAK